MCTYVCVCKRERETERGRGTEGLPAARVKDQECTQVRDSSKMEVF